MPCSDADSTDSVFSAENVPVEPLPKTFYELLEAIRNSPSLYLGRKSLKDLRSWLTGYSYARFQLGAESTHEEKVLIGFDEFVCRKYNWFDVGGWSAKIAYYYRDDGSAFDEFFRRLDEFRLGEKGHPE